jgi:hypothetical protein
MKKIARVIAIPVVSIILFSLIMSSCGEPCVDGSGTIRSEVRALTGFTAVTLLGDFDVYIEQSTTYEVVVQCDENILPYVVTENLSSGTLEIRHASNRCLDSSQPIRITIKTPDLFLVENAGSGFIQVNNVYNDQFEVVNSGSGDIDCLNLDTYDLVVTNSGSGQIYFKGKAINADMLLSGSGKVQAQDMDVNICKFVLSGSGTGYIFVIDSLKASVPGSGVIYYYGRPTYVETRIDGSGAIIGRDK